MSASVQITRDSFIKRLDKSGLMLVDDVATAEDEIPAIRSASTGETLARELVREYLLTEYQASVLLEEKNGPLRLGDYFVLEKIGEGGMGEVFKSRCPTTKESVAVKLLPEKLSQDPQSVLRFRREVEVATLLKHHNVVRAIGHGTHENQLYFVMEYVDGTNVSKLVQERGALSLLSAFDFLRDAVAGLQYAHEQEVVHRDIKPQNVLVHRNGTAKIMDLGLARKTNEGDPSDTVTELTKSGALLGTADYISPEQALNSKKADARSDIYSLGCTFYFMLVGRPPFDGETAMEKIIAHRESPIPMLQEARDDVPSPVEQIYVRMMSKDPVGRYQSAGELMQDLESCRKEFGHMWMLKRFLNERKGRHHLRSRRMHDDDSSTKG